MVGAAPSEVCRTAVPYHLDFDGEDLCRDGRGVELIFHDVQASSPQHLNLEGWHLTRAERHSSIGYRDHHRLLAYRTDLQMIVRIDGSGEVQLVVGQAESPIVLPATIAGAVLCGLGGWLLNARLGRRCPGRPGFMAGVVVVGVGAIQAFLPQCFYALVEFIGGYVNTGQPDPVWWPLGWLPIRILAGMGVVATIALLAASLLPMPPDKLALRRHPSTAVE